VVAKVETPIKKRGCLAGAPHRDIIARAAREGQG